MIVIRLLLALTILLCALSGTARAHEVRPGYLELRQLDAGSWDVLWKVPAKGERRLALNVQLPDDCSNAEAGTRLVGGAYIERWRTQCAQELVGRKVVISGLAATRTDVLARVTRLDGTTQTTRLLPSDDAFTVRPTQRWTEVAGTYLALGIEHIGLGIDHLLYVLALLFLVGNWTRLIGTVTAFTVAHSITLAAATLGWLRVPQSPIEAVIALSIVFISVEILHARQGRVGLGAKMPWLVAFLFGLLHGIGFAGALQEIGLPQHAIPVALAFFNIGVELGQLLFIAVVFGFLAGLRVLAPAPAAPPGTWDVAERLSVPAAYVVGTVAMFWVFERTLGFWV